MNQETNQTNIFPIFILLLVVFCTLRVFIYFSLGASAKQIVEGNLFSHPYSDENGLQIIHLEDLIVKTSPIPKYYAGDYVAVDASSAKNYSSMRVVYYPNILLDSKRQINWLRKIAEFRENLIARVQRNIRVEPYSSLLLGMTIGYKDVFPESFEREMRISGLMHVIVVSGYNVNLIVAFVQRLLLTLRLGRGWFLSITTVFLVFFLCLVGPDPPVLRAVIFGFVSVLALFFGEVKNSLYLLILIGFVLVSINPSYLLNVSFILSFLATLAVVTISRAVSLLRNPIAGDFLLIVWVNVILFPILSYYFEEYSLAGIFVNLIVSPLIPIITILGMAYVVYPNIVIGWGIMPFLTAFVVIVNAAKALKFLVIPISFTKAAIVVYYFFVILLLRGINLFIAEIEKERESRGDD